VIDEIETNIRRVIEEENPKVIVLKVHPFIHAYLTRGWFSSIEKKWRKKLGRRIEVRRDGAISYLEYRLEDPKGNEYEH
jgi:ribonuclease G